MISIAFPAIGCGQHGCSVEIVVNTFVLEMKKQLINRSLPWKVKFIVQPDQQNIYDEFCKQALTTHDGNLRTFFYFFETQLFDT
jgi:O-acetyl-ADP-ribose deacetylase (regulator of RNase III)